MLPGGDGGTALVVVVGGFFGDEGKGKIAAYLGLVDNPAIAVRTGAVNAGHTVVFEGRTWRLRVVPSSFINKKVVLAVAPGALIRLDVFLKEVEETGVRDRMFVDMNTGVIEEKHVELEKRDSELAGAIGSTLQGVGYAMSDRVLRRLRLAKDFPELSPYVSDVPLLVNEALDRGELVLVEGTQGAFLSLYHGTYPYVTSRDTTASAVLSEVGVGPTRVTDVILVFKSYVTRVGGGPLEGELSPEDAEKLGLVEYGSVTGRRRRVALFNLKLAQRAVMLNSPTQIAITKLDALFPDARCARRWESLPRGAREWVESIENALRTPVTLLGTGESVECVVDRRRDTGLLG
ncbi:MAG: adenylosuccinate synthetase [Acidilobaceae archaeon]